MHELPEGVEDLPVASPTQWMKKFELSQEEVDAMQEAKFLIESGAISSQVNIWVAKPGCGKTSILMHEAAQISKQGYQVLYVNMDCGAADLKYWRKLANQGEFNMITPHFKGAGGIEEWMDGLSAMSRLDEDLSKVVIVVDTLKKIADLMSKAKVKAAMGLLRDLTAKQCTIICAAHANKHRTTDGKLVFEGVGDIENDCDNLIYLEGSERDAYGAKTVTLEASDKVRGIFQKRSWQIKEDRSVVALDDVIDISADMEAKTQLEKDETVIEVIKEGIASGHHKRIELYNFASQNKIGRREFDAVIKRYCQGKSIGRTTPLWRAEKQRKDNASHYIWLESA
ncbi:AAA family ATPase [Pseudomonadales bacterium]|nr:AAA family ATPase [Pseudomonadales bacterium]